MAGCAAEKKISSKSDSAAGRPRVHDRLQIAADLVEWAQQDTSINLCAFCADHKPPLPPSKITQWSKECELFRQAYEITVACLGARRERRLAEGTLHVKAYDLNASTYDYFLRLERRNIAEFEHSLKVQLEAQVGEGIAEAYSKTMRQLTSIQEGKSVSGGSLNKESNKKSKDK